MNNNKIKAVLFIVLFLLLVAVVIFIVSGSEREREYEFISNSTITAAPLETVSPTPVIITTPLPTIYITSSPDPTPEPTPVPTPEPTPEPTPAPQPIGLILAEGKFSGDSGTQGMLDIDASYSVITVSDTQAQVNLSVDLKHFSLQTIGGYRLHLSVNDQFVTEETPPVDYDGQEGRKITTLGGHSFIVNVAPGETVSIPVQVQWDFGGKYHDIELDSLTCGGSIAFTRPN